MFDVMFSLKPALFGPSEGLIVLLADLIKGLRENDITTRVHASKRHQASLIECLQKNNVPEAFYNLELYRSAPALLRIVGTRRKRDRLRLRRWVMRQSARSAEAIVWLLSRANFLLLLVIVLACL